MKCSTSVSINVKTMIVYGKKEEVPSFSQWTFYIIICVNSLKDK